VGYRCSRNAFLGVVSSAQAIIDNHSHFRLSLTTGYSHSFSDIQIAFELFDRGLHVRIFFDFSLDRLGSVNNGGVIAPAKFIADGGKGSFGVFPAEIHGDLARQGDILCAPFGFEIADFKIEIVADRFLNIFDRDLLLGVFQRVFQDIFREFHCDRRFGQ